LWPQATAEVRSTWAAEDDSLTRTDTATVKLYGRQIKLIRKKTNELIG